MRTRVISSRRSSVNGLETPMLARNLKTTQDIRNRNVCKPNVATGAFELI
jgi:hypothetical protein